MGDGSAPPLAYKWVKPAHPSFGSSRRSRCSSPGVGERRQYPIPSVLAGASGAFVYPHLHLTFLLTLSVLSSQFQVCQSLQQHTVSLLSSAKAAQAEELIRRMLALVLQRKRKVDRIDP